MKHCLICGNELQNSLCPRCGFDESQCKELYPTLCNDGESSAALWVLRDSRETAYLAQQATNNDQGVKLRAGETQTKDGYAYHWTEKDGQCHSIFAKTLEALRDMQADLAPNPHDRTKSNSKKIIAISMARDHEVRLYEDGTVHAKGSNMFGQCDISNWTEIQSIATGSYHTVGLKHDGTVVAVGDNSKGQCNVATWTDIIAISAGAVHTLGLRKDGTVCAVGYNKDGQCDVATWHNIIAIEAGEAHTVGLASDGTVLATGDNSCCQCAVADWKMVQAIAAGENHSVGLLRNGTVRVVGKNTFGQCNVYNWKNIVSVAAGKNYTIGLLSNGTAFVAGVKHYQSAIANMSDIRSVTAGEYQIAVFFANGNLTEISSSGAVYALQ